MSAAVLASAGLFLIGLPMFPLLLLAPFPLLRLGLRQGPESQWRASLAAASLVAVAVLAREEAAGAGIALAAFLALVVLPVRLGLRGVTGGWGMARTLLAILFVEAVLVGGAVRLVTYSEVSPGVEIETMVAIAREDFSAQAERDQIPDQQRVELERAFYSVQKFVRGGYPAVVLLGLALGVAVMLAWVPRLRGSRDDPEVARFRFEEFRNPFWLVLVFVGTGGVTVVADGASAFVAFNALVTVAFLCFLQGFSVVYAFLCRLPVGRWFRWLVYLLILQFPVAVVVTGLGLFDEFYEFRRFRPPASGAD